MAFSFVVFEALLDLLGQGFGRWESQGHVLGGIMRLPDGRELPSGDVLIFKRHGSPATLFKRNGATSIWVFEFEFDVELAGAGSGEF